MTSTGEHVCKNCGNNFEENFCNKCGQRDAHRITTSHVIHDLVHVFLHADKGIFTFIGRIIPYPGIMAKEFIEGKRRIYNPFQYLVFAVAFILFLMSQSNFYESIEKYQEGSQAGLPQYFKDGMKEFNESVKKYSNLITFMSLPLYALFSFFIFKRRGHNYAEHFTIMIFALCQVYTLNSVVLLAMVSFNASTLGNVTISLLLMVFSFGLTYRQLYKLKWPGAIWKGIIVFVTSYILQMIIMLIFMLGYIFLVKRPG